MTIPERLAAFGWRIEQTDEGWELRGNGSPALFTTEDSLLVWLEHQERGRRGKPVQLSLWAGA